MNGDIRRSGKRTAGAKKPVETGLTLVGPGRVGQAIAKLLAESGFKIRFVAARRPEAARDAVRFIGNGRAVSLRSKELADPEIVLLTVADRALEPLPRQLAGLRKDWTGRVVLHTCGALPATVLRPFQRRGASIGSLHPFQTVPTPSVGLRNLPGCFWGIEGDRRACEVATRLARALDGTPFRLRPSWKVLYHAAAFLACPAVVTLLDQSARLLRDAGVPAGMVRPMLGQFVSETLGNFVALGGSGALTGPAVRGDWRTIEEHFHALRRHAPGLAPVYRELTRAMLQLARRRVPPSLFDARQGRRRRSRVA